MIQRIALFLLLVLGTANAQDSASPEYFRINAGKLVDTKVFLNVAYCSLSDHIRKDGLAELDLTCIDKKTGNYSHLDALITQDGLKAFLKRVGTTYEYKSGNLKTTKVSGILRKSSKGLIYIDVTERADPPTVKEEPTPNYTSFTR